MYNVAVKWITKNTLIGFLISVVFVHTLNLNLIVIGISGCEKKSASQKNSLLVFNVSFVDFY